MHSHFWNSNNFVLVINKEVPTQEKLYYGREYKESMYVVAQIMVSSWDCCSDTTLLVFLWKQLTSFLFTLDTCILGESLADFEGNSFNYFYQGLFMILQCP